MESHTPLSELLGISYSNNLEQRRQGEPTVWLCFSGVGVLQAVGRLCISNIEITQCYVRFQVVEQD